MIAAGLSAGRKETHMLGGPMGILLVWLFMAFVVEKLVEVVLRIFPFFDHKKIVLVDVALILALTFSLVIAFGANLDFFVMFEIQFQWPYVGPVISALLMMGGSSLVHDVLEWVQSSKETAKANLSAGSQPTTTVPISAEIVVDKILQSARRTSGVPPR